VVMGILGKCVNVIAGDYGKIFVLHLLKQL